MKKSLSRCSSYSACRSGGCCGEDSMGNSEAASLIPVGKLDIEVVRLAGGVEINRVLDVVVTVDVKRLSHRQGDGGSRRWRRSIDVGEVHRIGDRANQGD